MRFIEWDDPRQAVPAFLTIATMPLTYSIAYGLVIGLLTTALLWFCDFLWEVCVFVCTLCLRTLREGQCNSGTGVAWLCLLSEWPPCMLTIG